MRCMAMYGIILHILSAEQNKLLRCRKIPEKKINA